jgi:hypothetical protein
MDDISSQQAPARQWPEPQADWLPLARAVFKFGVGDDQGANAPHKKPLVEMTEAELAQLAESGARETSLGELTKMLEEKTGADEVEIHPDRGTFWFSFGAWSYGGPPWVLLQESRDIDSRLEAELLFTYGFVRRSDDEAARQAERVEIVRRATGLVWHQFMLRAFDRAVSRKQLILYARSHTTAPFEQLPSDIWPVLEVVDWHKGIACDPGDNLFYSIHVAVAADESAGGQPAGGGVTRTGLPGRPPKSKDWIEDELERRIDEGEITAKTTLRGTVESILDALPEGYARPTIQATENLIRTRFNQAKSRARQP